MQTNTQPLLFQPLELRGLTIRNRVCISPMCTYSGNDGMVNDWHLVHLGQYALGGAGIVFIEATAVEKRGRITYGDAGIWSDKHISAMARVTNFLKQFGATPAIQIAHAGRKSSTQRPWHGMGILSDADSEERNEKPWKTVSSTTDLMDENWHVPHALTTDDLKEVINSWRLAAERALKAGFEIVEVHCAHGYLIHQFLSPLINKRTDNYGGDFVGRTRFPLEVVESVRSVWPDNLPMFVRISSVDGMENGWSLEDSVAFARELKIRGVDVVDCSAGGVVGSATAKAVPRHLGFQVPFSEHIRKESGVQTMAVGLIVDGPQAERILQKGQADIIAVAREALYDPYWAHHAQRALNPQLVSYDNWPTEYCWWLEKREALIRKLREQSDKPINN
ncbi:MAG: NADH:flavin oxidoreductase / NADH oxidase [Candidatus Marinimicrobia bacterium]|nr:NADH:flavin oxidoreductase / NADH oxidase [Candidatus Neomarinimicrobiota bacterium]